MLGTIQYHQHVGICFHNVDTIVHDVVPLCRFRQSLFRPMLNCRDMFVCAAV